MSSRLEFILSDYSVIVLRRPLYSASVLSRVLDSLHVPVQVSQGSLMHTFHLFPQMGVGIHSSIHLPHDVILRHRAHPAHGSPHKLRASVLTYPEMFRYFGCAVL